MCVCVCMCVCVHVCVCVCVCVHVCVCVCVCVCVVHLYCSVKLSMFNIEKRYRNEIIIIVIIIIIIIIINIIIIIVVTTTTTTTTTTATTTILCCGCLCPQLVWLQRTYGNTNGHINKTNKTEQNINDKSKHKNTQTEQSKQTNDLFHSISQLDTHKAQLPADVSHWGSCGILTFHLLLPCPKIEMTFLPQIFLACG